MAFEKKTEQIYGNLAVVSHKNVTVAHRSVDEQKSQKSPTTDKEKIPPQFKTYITEYERQLETGNSVEESQKAAAKAVMDERHRDKEAKKGAFPKAALTLIIAIPLGFS